MKAIRGALAALALFSLTACPGPITSVPTPAEVADRTKIDEQAALTVTLAYTAAARAAALAIETSVVTDRATIAKIGALDLKAKAAVDAVEAAYRAGNASSYAAALLAANDAVSQLLASVKG